MRQERKLEKAIQRDGEQVQSDILDELKRRYPQYTKQADSKQAAVKKRRVAVFSSLAAVAACLAIILPCSLLLPNSQLSGDSGSDIYYCTVDEYDNIESEYTLGEYSQNHNGNILYFDWYEIAADILTGSFVRITNREILGLQESAYNSEKNEFITISVTKSNIFLSEFDGIIDICKNERNVLEHNVKSGINNIGSNCIFEHNGYRYFIKIDGGQDENRLFELVEDLLQNK